MKKLTTEQVKNFILEQILVDEPTQSPIFSNSSIPGKNSSPLYNVMGFPKMLIKDRVDEFLRINPSFPMDLLKEYTLEEENYRNTSYYSRQPNKYNCYILPATLDLVKYINSKTTEEYIKNWSMLVEQYMAQNTPDREREIVADMMEVTKNLFTEIFLQNVNLNRLTDVTDAYFLKCYNNGFKYLSTICKDNNPDYVSYKTGAYNSIKEFKEAENIIINLFENKEEIAILENGIMSTNRYGGRHYSEPEKSHANLLDLFKEKYFPNKTFDIVTPYLEKYRISYLYNYDATKRAGSETINYLKRLKEWNFDIVKEDYLHYYNTSRKKDVVKYVTEVLAEHKALPAQEQTLIEEKPSIVYRNKLSYSIASIRNHINNQLHGAVTLLKIVENSFRSDEDFDYLALNVSEEEGKGIFILEASSQEKLDNLTYRLKRYVEAVVCEEYLTDKVKTQLTKHNFNRTTYEDQKEVMEGYKKVKDLYITKYSLEKNLMKKEKEHKKTNKI